MTFSLRKRFNLYIPCIYSTIFPLYSFFCLTVPTPPFSAEGTPEDVTGNPDRGQAFAMCLQQVGTKEVWRRFHDVEGILGMYTGEIQAIWPDIRPEEHIRTRQKTSLTKRSGEIAECGGISCGGLCGGS